jgi:hypothetical protein
MPHEKDFLERRLAWYDQYVKGKASPAPEQTSE